MEKLSSPRSRTGSSRKIKSYFSVLETRDGLIEEMSALFRDNDVWITPVSSGPAFPNRKPGRIHTPIDVDGTRFPGNLAATGFTCPCNLTGFPAVVLPISKTDSGLPIGIQLVGKFQHDRELLHVAEAMSHWLASRPGFPGLPGFTGAGAI